ncbi:MAG: hypothetical protein GY869_20340 [Planctomycetes bacterium]|nr:hypothetical protein [Planctomycetota bacterium]
MRRAKNRVLAEQRHILLPDNHIAQHQSDNRWSRSPIFSGIAQIRGITTVSFCA